MLIANPRGHYQFLKGIDPYSCGAVADTGWEIVHVVLEKSPSWREGFTRVADFFSQTGTDPHALCAVELRSPEPFTMSGFIEFNQHYCAVLREWDLFLGDLNPVARTNVVPVHDPPSNPVLHAFSYTAPMPPGGFPSVIVAGAGEVLEGILEEERIIRRGDTSPAAMQEKAAYVMEVMDQRLTGLGGDWDWVNAVDVYSIHSLDALLALEVRPRMGTAQRHGLRLHHTRPPVIDIEFEMDMRGVRRELYI